MLNLHAASVAPCRRDHRDLLVKKVDQYRSDCSVAELMESSASWLESNRRLPVTWRPKGLLVAHLHEHRGAVNR